MTGAIDPYEDQFEKLHKEKKERVKKQEKQRLKNIAAARLKAKGKPVHRELIQEEVCSRSMAFHPEVCSRLCMCAPIRPSVCPCVVCVSPSLDSPLFGCVFGLLCAFMALLFSCLVHTYLEQ